MAGLALVCQIFLFLLSCHKYTFKYALFISLHVGKAVEQEKMRQLKGKTKETNKQKKERRKEFIENKQRLFTIVLPTFAAIFLLIAAYVYIKTRPKSLDY